MSFKDTGIIAFEAGADLEAARRVTINVSGLAVYAGATDPGLGVTKYAAKSGESVAVVLWNKPGTFEVEVDEAVTLNADLVAAANGKCTSLPAPAGTYVVIGKALSTASADGDIIEAVSINTGASKSVA